MKKAFFFACISTFIAGQAVAATSLLDERIWKVTDRKRSIFLDKGVFHAAGKEEKTSLNTVRNSYHPKQGYERIVFDFASSQTPRFYGHISAQNNKINLDFFNTELKDTPKKLGNAKYIQDIAFYNIDQHSTSVELLFKENLSFDIFYLSNPGRLVIDIKK